MDKFIELLDAILQRDFTKRQMNILCLILRLSVGTGKETANIPKKRMFELVGVDEHTANKELDWLARAKVIITYDSQYRVNPQCDQWLLPMVHSFAAEGFEKLKKFNDLSLNICAEKDETRTPVKVQKREIKGGI